MKTDNEVLAEFMDGKFEKREIMTYGGLRHGKWTFDDDNRWCFDDQLDYNTDWRRLMPVWYKFKELDGSGDMDRVKVFTAHCSYIEHAILHEGCSAACRLLAKGIRWYNEVKK